MDDDIKKNIANLKPSATLAINEKIKQLLKDGKKVFNFGFGQSPFPIPEKIVSVLRDNAHKKDYLPNFDEANSRTSVGIFLGQADNVVADCNIHLCKIGILSNMRASCPIWTCCVVFFSLVPRF